MREMIASVRRRIAQGDCPTEQPFSREQLEQAVVDLADLNIKAEVDMGPKLAPECTCVIEANDAGQHLPGCPAIGL